MEEVKAKKIWESKVFWLNAITFVLLQAQFLMQFDWMPKNAIEVLVSVVAIANIVLRVFGEPKLEG